MCNKRNGIEWASFEVMISYARIFYEAQNSVRANSWHNHDRSFLSLEHLGRSNRNAFEAIFAAGSSNDFGLQFIWRHNSNISLRNRSLIVIRSQKHFNIVDDNIYFFEVEQTNQEKKSKKKHVLHCNNKFRKW